MLNDFVLFVSKLLSELKLSDKLTMIGWIFTFIAFYIPWKTAYGKSISVEWEDSLKKISISDLSIGTSKYLHPKNKIAYIASMHVVNHSNVNIGYFDMKVTNIKTNAEHMIMMTSTVSPKFQDFPLLLKRIGIDGNPYQIILNMPPNQSGTFLANASTKFDLVITESPAIKFSNEIYITFSVTYKKSYITRIKEWIFIWIRFIKPWIISKIYNKKIPKPHTKIYKTFKKIYKLPNP